MSRSASNKVEPKDTAQEPQKTSNAIDRALDTLIAEHGGSPLTKTIGRFALSALVEAIKNDLKAGNSVRINHFGMFTLKPVKARTFFNPFSKVSENHEATVRLSFKPTPTLRAEVRGAHHDRAHKAPEANHEKKPKTKKAK